MFFLHNSANFIALDMTKNKNICLLSFNFYGILSQKIIGFASGAQGLYLIIMLLNF